MDTKGDVLKNVAVISAVAVSHVLVLLKECESDAWHKHVAS